MWWEWEPEIHDKEANNVKNEKKEKRKKKKRSQELVGQIFGDLYVKILDIMNYS